MRASVPCPERVQRVSLQHHLPLDFESAQTRQPLLFQLLLRPVRGHEQSQASGRCAFAMHPAWIGSARLGRSGRWDLCRVPTGGRVE